MPGFGVHRKNTILIVTVLFLSVFSFLAGYYLFELILWERNQDTVKLDKHVGSNQDEILPEQRVEYPAPDAASDEKQKLNYSFTDKLGDTEKTPSVNILDKKSDTETKLKEPKTDLNDSQTSNDTGERDNKSQVTNQDELQPFLKDSDKKYAIQVGSYTNKNDARILLKKLAAKGYISYIEKFDKDPKTKYYRVRIGLFRSKQEALKTIAVLKANEKLDPILVLDK